MSRLLLLGVMAALLAAATPADAPLLFQAEAQALSGRCDGRGLQIEGNRNTITVAGPCRSVLLKGVGNTVVLTVAPGAAIRVEGSGNRVRYTVAGAAPVVETLGSDNEVASAPPEQAAPPAKPAAGARRAMTLSGDDQEKAVDCAGRDVTLSGARSFYQLRGGCRSLTVRGDLLTVQADMQPGARIAVSGRGSVVTWRLLGRGRNPAAFAQGPGSRVQRALPGE